MKEDTKSSTFALLAGDDTFDPLEDGVRRRARCFIEAILEEKLQAALGRGRYERPAKGAQGHRNGHRERQVIGTFGAETVKVPRARLIADDGRTGEWRSAASPFAGRALPTGTGGIRDAGEKIQDRSLHRYEYRSEQAAVVPRP